MLRSVATQKIFTAETRSSRGFFHHEAHEEQKFAIFSPAAAGENEGEHSEAVERLERFRLLERLERLERFEHILILTLNASNTFFGSLEL